MFAGILLGPSLVGQLFPSVESRLFPPASLPPLYLISQLGVVLYMFVVGTDVDIDRLRSRARATVFISNAGIVVPFLLGVGLSWFLYEEYAPHGVAHLTFALFIGIAMSVTAFPVLARMLAERGLNETDIGNTAIGCAAVDDVSAWCLLALALAIGQGHGFAQPIMAVTLTAAVGAVALLVVRPRATSLFGFAGTGAVSRATLLRALIFLFVTAWATEAIGVHALFGAFIAGVAVAGAESIRRPLRQAIEPITSTLLLPLFFAYAGLRTEVATLSADAWVACALVLIVAVAGKFGAVSFAARIHGFAWRDAVALGALMNTRGLMELVVLNIGYDLGILSAQMYTMMVIMALTTTCMAGPVLRFLAEPRTLAVNAR